jgi:DNA-binding PadR family transcriptional regulator
MFGFVVLGLLRDGVPRHGYALMKDYEMRTGFALCSGNVYRALQRLVADGLIRVVPGTEGADARRAPYQITAQGVAAIDAWLARPNPVGIGAHHDELSTRAALIGTPDPTTSAQGLEQWREELLVLTRSLQRLLGELPAPESAAPEVETRHLIMTRRMQQLAVDLEFIDRLRVISQSRRSRRTESRETDDQPKRAAVNGRREAAANPRRRAEAVPADGRRAPRVAAR